MKPKILIHCAAGVSRSATIVIAYLIARQIRFNKEEKEIISNVRINLFKSSPKYKIRIRDRAANERESSYIEALEQAMELRHFNPIYFFNEKRMKLIKYRLREQKNKLEEEEQNELAISLANHSTDEKDDSNDHNNNDQAIIPLSTGKNAYSNSTSTSQKPMINGTIQNKNIPSISGVGNESTSRNFTDNNNSLKLANATSQYTDYLRKKNFSYLTDIYHPKIGYIGGMSLAVAYNYVLSRRENIQPNHSFCQQLEIWEKKKRYGHESTINELPLLRNITESIEAQINIHTHHHRNHHDPNDPDPEFDDGAIPPEYNGGACTNCIIL